MTERYATPRRPGLRSTRAAGPVLAALLMAATAVAPSAAQRAVGAGDGATPEELRALFPTTVAGLERASIRADYNDDGYPFVEAEYGGGSEGPAGGGGRSGTGVSLQAGLQDPGGGPVQRMLDQVRSRGGVTDTVYRGHRAHWLDLGPGGRGALVLTGDAPQGVALAMVRGEDAPAPAAALDALDIDGLAAMASGYRAPSFRTAPAGSEPAVRARSEGDGEALTLSHPEGWTVRDLSGDMGRPYLLVAREPVDGHLLASASNRSSSSELGGNVVVQASVSFARGEALPDALGRYDLPEHLFGDWEMAHDRRRVRIGDTPGMERRVDAVDRGGTAYVHRQLVFERGGTLLFVQTLVPGDAGSEVVAAVEAMVESVALEAAGG